MSPGGRAGRISVLNGVLRKPLEGADLGFPRQCQWSKVKLMYQVGVVQGNALKGYLKGKATCKSKKCKKVIPG